LTLALKAEVAVEVEVVTKDGQGSPPPPPPALHATLETGSVCWRPAPAGPDMPTVTVSFGPGSGGLRSTYTKPKASVGVVPEKPFGATSYQLFGLIDELLITAS